MHGRTIWIIIVLMLLLDLYVFQVVKFLTHGYSPRVRLWIGIGYWSVSVAVVLLVSIIPSLGGTRGTSILRNYLLAIVLGLFLAKLLASLFFLTDDFRRLIQWTTGKLFFDRSEGEAVAGDKVSRSVFLSWVGIVIGGGLFATLIYGFRNKYNYHIKRITLSYPCLLYTSPSPRD